MTKNILVLVCTLALLFTLPAFAQEAVEPAPTLSGLVMEITPEGDLLIHNELHGELIVHVSDETELIGFTVPTVGQYIYITFNGAMTMSLPGQITAQRIESHALQGTVLGVAGNTLHLQVEEKEYCLVLDFQLEVAFHKGEVIHTFAYLTEETFVGLPVVYAEYIGVVPPVNARK